MQKSLAEDLTKRVHSEKDLEASIEASQILFGQGTTEMLKKLDEKTLLSVFSGVPQSEITRVELENGIGLFDLLCSKTGIFASNSEARRMIKDNAVLINKERIKEDFQPSVNDLLNNRFILVQKGKKNYYLVKVV